MICLKEECPMETTENVRDNRLWVRLGEKLFELKDRIEKPNTVNRKKYLWLCLLSIVGANQFYAGHYVKGLFYLALSWTGISVAMGFIDWMAAVPRQADDDGNIMV